MTTNRLIVASRSQSSLFVSFTLIQPQPIFRAKMHARALLVTSSNKSNNNAIKREKKRDNERMNNGKREEKKKTQPHQSSAVLSEELLAAIVEKFFVARDTLRHYTEKAKKDDGFLCRNSKEIESSWLELATKFHVSCDYFIIEFR